MADQLDGLIEWLVDEVVYSGDDGISVSELLARIGVFYHNADKPTRSTQDRVDENPDQIKPIIDDTFKLELWKRLVGHQDVTVGENGSVNHSPLGDAEVSLSNHESGTSLQGYNHGPSSPSTQLLEHIQSRPIHEPAPSEDDRSLPPAKSTRNSSNAVDENSVSSLQEDEVDLIVFNENHTPDAISSSDDGIQVQKAFSSRLDAFQLQSRIYASTTRKWMTVAGHELDFRRVDNSHWQCLYLIAQARDSGISQEHLLQATGQDEKILSVQLNHLMEEGYVIRGHDMAEDGLGSNIFILKRFSDEITSPRPETAIDEATTMSDTSNSLLKEDGKVAKVITTADEMAKNDKPRSQPAQRKDRLLRVKGPLSKPAQSKEKRGRPRLSWATHTSYDECQRLEGFAGVYRDLPQFDEKRTSTGGRPKSQLMLLFKSENLKLLPWFHKESEENSYGALKLREGPPISYTYPQASHTVEEGGASLATKRSRAVDIDESENGPPPKRAIIDMVRNFGRGTATPYQTPYHPTTPSVHASPKPALSLPKSTFTPRSSALPETPTPSERSVSPYASSVSALTAQITSPKISVTEVLKGPKTRSKAAAVASWASTTTKPQASLKPHIKDQGGLTTNATTPQDEQPQVVPRLPGDIGPRYFSRLSAKINGVAGILYLSLDRQSLTFSADKGQPDTPETTIQISEIKEPPENIAIDSSNMELRVTTTDENENSTSHSFHYFATEAEDGNIMRANIVTAILILDLDNDEDSTEAFPEDERAFKCDKCGGSWKNREGIKYHLTRSKTACNPSFEQRKRRKTGGRPKRSAVEASRNDTRADGILAEESNQTLNKPTGEPSQFVAKPAKLDTDGPTNLAKTPKPHSPYQISKEIIAALLDIHGGFFPGECSLWDALVATWLQTNPESSLPDRSSLDTTINSLIDSGCIRSMQFSFKDEKGLMKMRTIITKNDIDPTSTAINELKELIKATFPGHYHPALITLPKVVQFILKAREDQNNRRVTRSGRVSKPVQKLSSLEDNLFLHPAANQGGFGTPQSLNEKSDSDVEYEDLTNLMHTPEEDSDSDSDYSAPKKREGLRGPAMEVVGQSLKWQPAENFQQNEPGAWSSLTEQQLKKLSQVEKNATQAKIKRKWRRLKIQLPEPITYMQTLNSSAWAFRPYGHGVRPIQARPSSRISTNGTYLEKIERGFRPVIMPNGYGSGPILRSKTLASTETGAMATPSMEWPRRKRMRSPSIGTDVHDENSVPRTKRRRRPPKTPLPVLNFDYQSPAPAPHPNSLLPDANPRFKSRSPGLGSFPYVVGDEVARLLAITRTKSSHSSSQALSPSAQLDDDRLETPKLGSNEDDDISTEVTPEPLFKKKNNRREPSELTTRRLTALPIDLVSVQSAIATYPDLAVQVAVNHHQNHARRRTKKPALSRQMEYRLKVAVVVIRSLTGGLDKAIDWVLVSKIFPQFPLSALLPFWPPIAAQHKESIGMLGRAFEDFFVKAYAEGLVPPINYDNLVDYDWGRLVDLVIGRVVVEGNHAAPPLPASRSELDELYDIKEERQRHWRDDFFHHHMAVYKRIEMASMEQVTLPLGPEPQPQQVVDSLVIARSWARANTLTPKNTFDTNFAQFKLSTVPDGLLRIATKELISRKVINHRNRGRPVPGRGFESSEGFEAPFRKNLNERHLSDAYAFKTSLDRAFLLGETLKVEWAANDGDVLAMTNLQAHGRVDLIPGNNVPMNRFGLTDGDYQTKRMQKSKLLFDVEIRPTSAYLYTLQLPILSKSPYCLSCPDPVQAARPPKESTGAIPVWYDISGHLIKDLWKKTLCTVLGTVALRPGIGVKELERLFAPALEEWEIRLLMQWGCKVGAVVDIREEGKGLEWRDGAREGGPGEPNKDGKGKESEEGVDERQRKLHGVEGWSTGEWWWAIGGRDW